MLAEKQSKRNMAKFNNKKHSCSLLVKYPCQQEDRLAMLARERLSTGALSRFSSEQQQSAHAAAGQIEASPRPHALRAMFAVVESGGKQYRVAKGVRVTLERLPAEVGESVVFDRHVDMSQFAQPDRVRCWARRGIRFSILLFWRRRGFAARFFRSIAARSCLSSRSVVARIRVARTGIVSI